MTLRDDGELGVARPRCCVFFFAHHHHHHHIISCVVIKVACSGLTSGLLFISKEEAHTRGKKKTKQSLCSLMCHKLNNKSLFAPFGKKPPLAVCSEDGVWCYCFKQRHTTAPVDSTSLSTSTRREAARNETAPFQTTIWSQISHLTSRCATFVTDTEM